MLGFTLFVVLAQPLHLRAQAREPGGVSFGYETTHDRFFYRFENPSTFSTDELVPHEFTQTYWGDHQWVVVRGRFNAGTHVLESELGATPQRSTRGDDYDTFFEPSGDVVVVGTTGNVSMRSWRLRQTVGLARKAGFDWSMGYQYRRDRSEFHPGLKTTSHTRPSSLESFIIYTRETTISENFALDLGLSRQWTTSNGWRVRLGVSGSPATNARLTTLLPDKYPGQTIVFTAIVGAVSPSFSATYGNKWPLTFSAGYTRTFSYLKSRQFERKAARLGFEIGFN